MARSPYNGFVMATANPRPWTYELYALLPEDGRRHEIIGGEHYVTPSPDVRHQRVVAEVAFALTSVVKSGGQGVVLTAPCDVFLSETDTVQPDVLYISRERSAIMTETKIQGAPDLVVEVLSPSTRRRDEILKRDLYERFGVVEYWIVDPELETVKVWRRLSGAGFDEPLLCEGARMHRLTTPLLPELALDVATLFPAA